MRNADMNTQQMMLELKYVQVVKAAVYTGTYLY